MDELPLRIETAQKKECSKISSTLRPSIDGFESAKGPRHAANVRYEWYVIVLQTAQSTGGHASGQG